MLLYGKQELITENALRRFTHHCKPEISTVLRHGKYASINEALSKACEEEAFRTVYNQTKSLNINKKQCKICKRTNHDTNQCRFKNSNNQGINNTPQYNIKICTYCHLRWHTIDECGRKKNNQNFYPDPKVAHVSNEIYPQEHLSFEEFGFVHQQSRLHQYKWIKKRTENNIQYPHSKIGKSTFLIDTGASISLMKTSNLNPNYHTKYNPKIQIPITGITNQIFEYIRLSRIIPKH